MEPGPPNTTPTGSIDDEQATDSTDSTDQPETNRGTPFSRWLLELVIILLAAFVLAIVIRAYVAQTFSIPSVSMYPTLQVGDRVVVNKLSYKLHDVDRGDIIVFRRPPRENCPGPPVADLVKRVIGLPGETISSRGNVILINGHPLAQPWFTPVPLGPPITTQKIPPNQYFVMGDNRADSCDSRYWGTVSRNLIVGKVELRIWPLSRIHIF